MKHTILIVDLIRGAAIRRVGISVVGYQKIAARLRPKVVGFTRVDVGTITVRHGYDVEVVRGIGRLPADVHLTPLTVAMAVPFTRLLMNGALGFWKIGWGEVSLAGCVQLWFPARSRRLS
jgi:hypothetical protein